MMTKMNKLSKREIEISELLLQGMSNKQIALNLGISDHTVEFHLKNIYEKLQVSSRTGAILTLGKSTGTFGEKPGKSIVDSGVEKSDNRDSSLIAKAEISDTDLGPGFQKSGTKFEKYKILILVILILVGIAFAAILVFVLFKQAKWENYQRECEYPDMSTAGQMIWRSNASDSRVHGQFGAAAGLPWPAQAGYVMYQNINIPGFDQLFLKLRYSKNSPASVPILIYIDDETAPRASIHPKDQHNWDQFTWTEPILLGKIDSGVHSIKLFTDGQQYGVADLDMFILTNNLP